ncbi:MAG: carbon storage regulator CsrA [Deltaproteobacteria bacterium]|nr:carbon storage regulator CsrA [Deltaproteobacteria bacterium]
MLVVTRKVRESLNLGDDISVTIISVRGNTVKLGVEAPRNVQILRGELLEKVKSENLEALTVARTQDKLPVDELAMEIRRAAEKKQSGNNSSSKAPDVKQSS